MSKLKCQLACLMALCMLLGQVYAQNVNNLCVNADAFCVNDFSYPSSQDGSPTPDLPADQRGCMYYTPAPAWYVLRADNPGDMLIQISHLDNKDVNFACWGPFHGYATREELLQSVCTSQLTGGGASHHPTSGNHDPNNPGSWGGYPNDNLIDCSYSAASTEYCYIPSAQTGDWYVLLICNISRAAGNISVSVQSGTATLGCDTYVEATNNGPVFEGSTVRLFCNASSNNGYSWTGPNGFTSSVQNPVITNATLANAGEYAVTLIPQGETAPVMATTYVTVYPRITISILAPFIRNENFQFPHH